MHSKAHTPVAYCSQAGAAATMPSTLTPSVTLAELRAQAVDSSQLARDLSDALKREELLRKRVAELVATLERLSRNADSRHKQSTEFVSDLKKANR